MSKNKATKTEKLIDIIGITAFVVAFVIWRVNDDAVNIAGTLTATVSLSLFIIICIHLVHNWMSLWSEETDIIIAKSSFDEKDKKISVACFFGFLLFSFAVLIIIHEIRVLVFRDTTTFTEGLELFLWIDTGYYLKIAEQWYVNDPHYIYGLVFYPGYPVLIMVLNNIIHNYLYSAVIISVALYATSASLLYRYLRLDYERKDALRGIKYLAILPATFFFVSPMSESLFFFLCVAVLLLIRQGRWFAACICGVYCAFTRSLGVLIIVPIIFNCITGMIREKDKTVYWVKRILFTCTIPLGTVGYLYINYRVTGNWFAFSELEQEMWNQSMGLFFDSIAFQTDNALAVIQEPYYTHSLGLWFPNVGYCLGVLVVMVLASKKMKPGYLLWFICYYFLAIGVTYLISAPRYLVVCLPFILGVIEITKDKKVDSFITAFSIIFGAYYLFAFAARWEVF